MSRLNAPKPRYFDRTAAAAFVGESRMTIIRDEQAGRLTPVRFRRGGKVHYRVEEVEALAEGVEDPDARLRTKAARMAREEKRRAAIEKSRHRAVERIRVKRERPQ